jgi:hypothetical protein
MSFSFEFAIAEILRWGLTIFMSRYKEEKIQLVSHLKSGLQAEMSQSLRSFVGVGVTSLLHPKPTYQTLSHQHMEYSQMAVDFSQFANNKAQSKAAASDDKQKSQVWLNIGINIPLPQADGSVENVFVSLPFGLALDTMEHAVAKGNSKDWAHMVQAKNWLLDELKKASDKIAPGKTETITGLEIQMRKIGEAEAANPNENMLLKAMSAKFAS